jgi:hypothetical protein
MLQTSNPEIASSPTGVSVGATTTPVLAANPNRTGLTLVNTSPNTISISFDVNPAVLNSGITLVPNGMFVMDEFTFTTQAVNAIASLGSSNLSVQEFVA